MEEEEHYLERSLKAAANSCAELVTCPRPDCKGVAVTGLGAACVSRTQFYLRLCGLTFTF